MDCGNSRSSRQRCRAIKSEVGLISHSLKPASKGARVTSKRKSCVWHARTEDINTHGYGDGCTDPCDGRTQGPQGMLELATLSQ